MKRSTLIVIVLAVVLSGCKIKVTVPEGGSVKTQSGAFSCAAGKMCTIDVVDLFFDEVFVATADGEHQFIAWQGGDRTFCGGSSNPCTLSTAGFAGNSILMSFLEGDEKFHLKPYFARKGSDSLTPLPLRQCLDEDMLSDGYRSDITVQLYDDDDGRKKGTLRTRTTVSGPVTYKGQTVMKTKESVTQKGPLDATYELTFFSRVNIPKARATVLGGEQLSLTPVRQFTKISFTPGFLQRLDLLPGESYTTRYAINLTFPNGERPPLSQENRTKIIYEGAETITVPAGTFMACRIHRFDTIDGLTSEAYNWVGKGNGLLLREANENFVPAAEVLRGSIRGAPL